MKDCWYADNRDLIKWGVLLHLANDFEARRVLQLAYYRPSVFGTLDIGGVVKNIPPEVIAHFRDIQRIGGINSKVRVTVFDPIFDDRAKYLNQIKEFISAFSSERCIVFLDPDTGLEPQNNPGFEHVLDAEANDIWNTMKKDDVFVIYQHRIRIQNWIRYKKTQLATALGVVRNVIQVAKEPNADDIVLFFTQKP